MTIPLSLAFGLLLAQHQGHGVTQPHEDHAPSAQQQQDHAAPAQPEGTGPAVPPRAPRCGVSVAPSVRPASSPQTKRGRPRSTHA